MSQVRYVIVDLAVVFRLRRTVTSICLMLRLFRLNTYKRI